MASLELDSLFTNIPLDQIIYICIKSLSNDNENIPKNPEDFFQNFKNNFSWTN